MAIRYQFLLSFFELCFSHADDDLRVNSSAWQSLLSAGTRAVQQHQPAKALRLLERAFALAPSERQVRYWLANACRLSGDATRAERLLDDLIEENAADIEAAFARAFLLRESGRDRDAVATLVALRLTLPDELEVQLKVAGFLRDSNRFDEAVDACRRASELAPQRADILFSLARLHQARGEFEQALDALRRALALDSGIGGAWLSLAQLQRFKNGNEADFLALENAARRDQTEETQMCIAFALGKANDDLGRWAEAWRHYQRGNGIRAREQPWDRNRWRKQVKDTLESGLQPRRTPCRRRPVFIVGMLRAGTTLLEQRLDRHPAITGRGELNFLPHIAQRLPAARASGAQDELADELWSHMRLQDGASGYYIDKNPLNFRFLGALFEIMPESRVIHVRRDGRDSCLSCYFQLFQHADAGFCNSLEDLLDYYRGYRELMAHWRSRFAAQIHEIDYSDLVENTEATIASVLGFLGADWDPAVLETGGQARSVRTASAWQARQPLYARSIQRWKNYQGQAPEFFDTLARIDEAFR
jgi:Flp pilus assembly protein TadD